MTRATYFLFLILAPGGYFSQAQLLTLEDYQSDKNPYYWKHDLPRAGYWQQDVYYRMEATLDDSTDVISGTRFEVDYANNSSDTLTYIYFHLYQNAFQPGSYMESLYKNNDRNVKFGAYEKKKLGTTTENIQVDGVIAQTELDNTILKVLLPKPLLPGTSTTITMQFKTYFDAGGNLRRRMKTYMTQGYKHFDGVHWYPSVAVYDEKFGWTTEQHMDKEFYADFGVFDVKLTFPNAYITEASGYLVNPEEMYPGDLRDRLDLTNFEKPSPEISTPIIPDGTFKTWHFRAENVHNFAFTSDPLYRIGAMVMEGTDVIAVVQEPHAHKWQKSAGFTARVIQIYSHDFGQYAWPKIIIADANDGMEYPMLTLDGGGYPGHQGLIAHEVGHMWFYGMIGTNETYRAFMDEGFTQFLTVWSLDKINGEEIDYESYIRAESKNKYQLKHLNPKRNRYERLYFPYLRLVHQGFDYPLNTHSSDFNGSVRHGGGYGLVYFKTGVMLYNLKYVLGDELFSDAMKFYFDRWKMAHPYPEDFKEAIMDFTKTDLNWFFDQWLETTKYIDYGIDKVQGLGDNEYEITFTRHGSMQMPVDFDVMTETDTMHFHIPNTWFTKPTDAQVLPRWYGWGNIQPTHTVKVKVPGKLKNVMIDPSFTLADINMRDNRWTGGYQFKLDHKVRDYPNWFETENFHRPDVWYNAYDGIQAGWHVEGNYFKQTSFYSASFWFNTRLLQGDQIREGQATLHRPFAFHLYSKESLTKTWSNLYLSQYLKFNAGLLKGGLQLEKTFKPNNDYRRSEYTRLSLNLDLMYRPDSSDLNYVIYEDLWSVGKFNNTSDLKIDRHYVYEKGDGLIEFTYRAPAIRSDFNYSYVQLNVVNENRLGKFDFRSRVVGRLGFGNTPAESALYFAGASPEDMYDNKYTRARGWFPHDWYAQGADLQSFHAGGGLNLRGYSGYVLAEGSLPADSLAYFGQSGTSVNLELDFNRFIKWKPKTFRKFFHFNTYLFTDMGFISFETVSGQEVLSKLRMDAGVGTSLKITFGKLDIEPLVIRFDVPFFLNRPPASDGDYFGFRYVMGIDRAF